jgi:hypothetical protein
MRALLFLLLAAAPLAAQDPWASVPALPTACYAKEDDFGAALGKVRDALQETIGQRKQSNPSLKKLMADPATFQQRLLAAMQKDPAKAAQLMDAIQQFGAAESQASAAVVGERQAGFEERRDKLAADYGAEKNAVMGPIHVRIRQHSHESGGSAADEEVVRTGWIEYNRQYEKVLCPKWFGTKAPALLAEYKAYLVGEMIPKELELEAGIKQQLELFGVPVQEYRSVAALNGVAAYLDLALGLFGNRQSAASMP